MQNKIHDATGLRWAVWRNGAVDYVLSMRRDGWEFCLSDAADQPIAIAAATAASLLKLLDALGRFSSEEKSQWAEYLLGCLGEDGFVADPVDLAEPTQVQPIWALQAHRTRHIAWAVEVLGGRLRRPIRFVEPLLESGEPERWLTDLWRQVRQGGIWRLSNWIMDATLMLDLRYRHFRDLAARRAIDELLDALDRRQDTESGYWFCPGDDLRCAMAGSMHLYPIYWAYGRPVHHMDKVIENTLALQQSDGLFDYGVGAGGSQCLDYDAVFVLVNGAAALPARQEPVRDCCRSVLDAIVVNHNEDGSFSNDRVPDQVHHWATKAAAFRSDGGSLWDTYARLMTIAMCIEQITGRSPSPLCGENNWLEISHAGTGWRDGCSPALADQFRAID